MARVALFRLTRNVTIDNAVGGAPIALLVAGTMLAAGVGGILLHW